MLYSFNYEKGKIKVNLSTVFLRNFKRFLITFVGININRTINRNQLFSDRINKIVLLKAT